MDKDWTSKIADICGRMDCDIACGTPYEEVRDSGKFVKKIKML